MSSPHEITRSDAAAPAMEDMAQILAHRIRGLVMTIEGFTDLLAESLPGRAERELAFRIFESAARIESILSDLQVYARQTDPACEPTTMTTLLVDLLDALDEHAAPRVDLELPVSDANLSADAMMIRQALLVLVVNALEATAPDGRVSVRGVTAGEGIARFEVRNEGVLNEKVAAQAFQPFFTTKAHNLGVGLSLAQRIAACHGGRVYLAANDAAEGTCFAFDLPRPGGGEVVQ